MSNLRFQSGFYFINVPGKAKFQLVNLEKWPSVPLVLIHMEYCVTGACDKETSSYAKSVDICKLLNPLSLITLSYTASKTLQRKFWIFITMPSLQ